MLVDTDELLLPRQGGTLVEELARHPDASVLGSEGYDVLPGPGEGPYEPAVPLLWQRRFGVRNIEYDKPLVLRPDGPERLSPGHHYLLNAQPRPSLCPFYLAHLAAADEGLFLRRRLRMVARQGERNRVAGYGRQYNDQTEESLRQRFRDMSSHPLLRRLPFAAD
jgi:hypothetical protein